MKLDEQDGMDRKNEGLGKISLIISSTITRYFLHGIPVRLTQVPVAGTLLAGLLPGKVSGG